MKGKFNILRIILLILIIFIILVIPIIYSWLNFFFRSIFFVEKTEVGWRYNINETVVLNNKFSNLAFNQTDTIYKELCYKGRYYYGYYDENEGIPCTIFKVLLTKEGVSQQMFDILENKCRKTGGKIDGRGFYADRYGGKFFANYYNCYISFSDAEKECTNSKQCQGVCLFKGVVPKSEWVSGGVKCTDVCVGGCSKYPANPCDGYVNIEDGVINNLIKALCD